MSEPVPQKAIRESRRRRKRLRTPRRLLLLLLVLGLTGLSLGIGLLVASFIQNNAAFRTYGLFYVAASLVILLARFALRAFHHIRKRKYTGAS